MNIKKFLIKICFLFLLSNSVMSQNQNINFVTDKTWDEIKATARKKGTYIFVDCYATWCSPCKKMDKEVFIDKDVIKFMDSNFISVRVQMDTSFKDNETIKLWYNDAKKLRKEFGVKSFPTHLYLSPEGILVHKGIGFKNKSAFIILGREALDSTKQYYVLKQAYDMSTLKPGDLKYLALTALSLKDFSFANKAAQKYIHNSRSGNEFLLSKDNIEFVIKFTKSTKDEGFTILYENQEKINEVMNDAYYIQPFIHHIISKEEIDPYIKLAIKADQQQPDWDKIENNIKSKYGNYLASKTILAAKTRWYGYKKDYSQYTSNLVLYVSKYGKSLEDFQLNEYAWHIFLFSKKKNELIKASKWMKPIISSISDSTNLLPASLDTYANLLYKIGTHDEAIRIETKALSLAVMFDIRNFIRDYSLNLKKMKSGTPTW